jgi:hypothetical protein
MAAVAVVAAVCPASRAMTAAREKEDSTSGPRATVKATLVRAWLNGVWGAYGGFRRRRLRAPRRARRPRARSALARRRAARQRPAAGRHRRRHRHATSAILAPFLAKLNRQGAD